MPDPKFDGELDLKWLDDGRRMQLLAPFAFTDGAGLAWPVPAHAVIDGASIPRLLWGVVGGPYEGKYRNASVVHDWYCAVRTREWPAVHRMFYEAMLASGVDAGRAKIMYLAVRYAGPRWDALTIDNSRLAAGLESDAPPEPAPAWRPPADADAFAALAARMADASLAEIDSATA